MGRRSRHQGLFAGGAAATALAVAALMVAAVATTYAFTGGRWPFGGDTVALPGAQRPTPAASTPAENDPLPLPPPVEESEDPEPTPHSKPSKRPSATPSAGPPTPSATPTKTTPTPTSSVSADDLAEVVRLTNVERKKAGCTALTSQSQLRQAAQLHSEWQADHGLNHTGAGGSRPGDRATAAGYRWTRIGENVANGYRTPDAVMEAWMLSAPHKQNIVNCAYRRLGVGLAEGSEGLYWTQLFGA